MKRLLVLTAVSLLGLGIPSALAGGWGLGAFGGVNFPVEQDDATNGTVFGVKGRWTAVWALTVEPQIFLLKNGDYDVVYDKDAGLKETLTAWKATSFGANLVLGAPARPFTGARPFIFGGVRMNAMDFEGRDEESKFGFAAGVGVEIGLGHVGVEFRGAGEVSVDGDSSRKNGVITAGLNLYLGQ